MQLFNDARVSVWLGAGPDDRAAALALRARVFRGDAASDEDAHDTRDAHDTAFRPLLVRARTSGVLLACARVRIAPGSAIAAGYTARFYDLAPVAARFERAIEVGRLCAAFAGIAVLARAANADLVFGCTSCPAADPASASRAFARLGPRHLAPARWRPRRRARETLALVPARTPQGAPPSLSSPPPPLPPLLRLYVGFGAVVSDHAVIDRDLGTVHVFTALPLGAAAKVPARAAPARSQSA